MELINKTNEERDSSGDNLILCPVCTKSFSKKVIEDHVNKCLFLNTTENAGPRRVETKISSSTKRSGSHLYISSNEKRLRVDSSPSSSKSKDNSVEDPHNSPKMNGKELQRIPLAEQMRPQHLGDIVGQTTAFGPGSMLRCLLEQKKVTNMILWGPPGCGKTSLANVISKMCKEQNNMRFVKLSATMSGIGDVKEVVKVAKNEAQYKRQTVLFMDEIHRFNKLQQDTFLPHVENGTIILIGATTENPSFSLNNALLSRCRVVVMEKLSVDDVLIILKKALENNKNVAIMNQNGNLEDCCETDIPGCIIEEASLRWLAEVCDGDARVALGALELALASRPAGIDVQTTGPATITLDDVKDGIKRSHMVYDRAGEQHYNTISALHKSVRAGDDNAALYWCTRALQAGDQPLYIARRLVRIAAEDIGLADPNALVEAVACLQGCQHIGMPECDVVLAQCAVRLARAPKSREVYDAMKRCQRSLAEAKGPLPPVPLHLRNAPTKLMKQLGYGDGYNLLHKDDSGLEYMPEGMENVDFFRDNGG